MLLENRNVLLESPWIWVLERSGNPVRYFYVEFSILVKQFANLIWLLCFSKKLFDKPTSIKGRICGMSEHYESLGCLIILSFTFQPQWLFVCVFRLSKRIQKYSVTSCVFNQELLGKTINPQFSSWVKTLKDPNRVLCCYCQRAFALSNMGKRALASHMSSDKHKRNVSAKVPSISSYCKKPTAPSKTSVPNSADTDTDHKLPVLLQLKQIDFQWRLRCYLTIFAKRIF